MRVAMLSLLLLLLLGAFWRVSTSSFTYATQDRDTIAAPVSRLHPAGTDELGRDTAVRLSAALLLSLAGACCASALSSMLAMFAGCIAAFNSRWLARTLLYLGDLFLILPWLFLLMLVRSALPLTLSPVLSGLVTFSLLALLGAPTFLRLNYEKVAALRSADWLLQGHAAGLRSGQLFRHLLPHLRPLLWTQFLLYLPACLIAEANLGTLGLGLGQPLPSLGNFLVNLQTAALLGNVRLACLPALVLVLVLVALELAVFGVEA